MATMQAKEGDTCGECKIGILNIDPCGEVEQLYIPAYYIRGWFSDGLPRRTKPGVVIGCNSCEFAKEVRSQLIL